MADSIVHAVAYYRMSTSQQAASIPEQTAWAAKAARAHGVEIVAEFQDGGISGDVRDRPGLLEMLAYCESHAGELDAVVVWDGDRLSRADSIKTAVFLDRLISVGVTRLLTQEGWTDFDSDLDRLLYNIRQDMGRLAYSKSLSKNVARSGLRRAREGRWVCGRPPYGYVVGEDGHLTIGDPAKAEAVRGMFRHFVATAASLGDLARKLNESATKPPAGTQWNRYSVRTVLTNPAYMGDIVWNVRTRAKHSRPVPSAPGEVAQARKAANRRSKKPQLNAEADRVIVEDAHPALVDRETFAAVAAKLVATRHRRTTPIAGGGNWVLSGMLYCGDCGHRMTGSKETKIGKDSKYTYHTYGCCANKRFAAGTCWTNRVHQETLLREIAGLVRCSFSNPERLRQLRDEMEAIASEQGDERAAERESLKSRIRELDKQLDLGAERLLLCPAEVQTRAAAKLKQWQGERDAAARELTRLDAASEAGESFTTRVGEALMALQTIEERIAEAPADAARDVLAGIVEKVTLHFDHGQKSKAGRRQKTLLREMEVQLIPEVAALLGTNPNMRSLVGYWKKYSVGNQTFEELEKAVKQ